MKIVRFDGSVDFELRDGETVDDLEDRLLDSLEPFNFACYKIKIIDDDGNEETLKGNFKQESL